MLGFLRDTYYNLKFKTRSGVTTPKQIAMAMEPTLQKTIQTVQQQQDNELEAASE